MPSSRALAGRLATAGQGRWSAEAERRAVAIEMTEFACMGLLV